MPTERELRNNAQGTNNAVFRNIWSRILGMIDLHRTRPLESGLQDTRIFKRVANLSPQKNGFENEVAAGARENALVTRR